MKKTIAALAIATLLISSLPAVILAAPPDNAVPASDFSPEQILVKFKPDVTLPEAAEIHRQLFVLADHMGNTGLRILTSSFSIYS